ncbi:MAG TPA: hypothetical protein VFB68_20455 [Xanthobacteraceae bacterium]|nr:hypothetical protein [Xanthobacteraceae bacterium]
MNKLRNTVLLLGVAGIAAAAAPFLTVSPDLCFTAGSVTYQLSANAPFPDYRVAIDNQAAHPDLRVRLVNRVDAADFALTDDAGTMVGNGCKAAGPVRTIGIVPAGAASDLTIAVSSQSHGDDPDFTLYVHSARVSHFDAAALFALVRQAPDGDRQLNGADHVASIR